MTATYYPVALALRGRRAVVVADGEIAVAKARSLLAAGAQVAVVTPSPTRDLLDLAATKEIELHPRAYKPGDLAGAYLAIAAPNDRAANRSIWREAEARHVLLNAVDDVEHCHFIAPAIVTRGPVTVSVSTSSASPALAVRLREAVARLVRREHGELATILGAARAEVARAVPDLERRKSLWFEAVDSDAIHELARGRDAEARAIIADLVARASAGTEHQRPRGFVTLVGAGPGRPGLITVDGLRELRRADAVVYDRLVHRSVVRAAPVRARRIFAGKAPYAARISQEWINETLISLAQEGLRVVRLKGGDPFVFGRGAEECAALEAAGIAHRVVPGISSAIAAPAAAGIPVTHRRLASSFVVVSAEQASHAALPDWQAIARIPTIVVMMGVAQLRNVLDRLRASGVRDDAPAAVIAAATREDQKTVVGTLATIAAQAEAAAIAPPATLVIGDVVHATTSQKPVPPAAVLLTETYQ